MHSNDLFAHEFDAIIVVSCDTSHTKDDYCWLMIADIGLAFSLTGQLTFMGIWVLC